MTKMLNSVDLRKFISINGFTLMELLTVLFLISIIITMTALSIKTSSATKQWEEEVFRLANLLKFANQEAILQTKEIGVFLHKEGYQFYQLDGEQWRLIKEEDELLRPRQFLAGLQMEVSLEGQNIHLSNGNSQDASPLIFLFSTGEITPFVILFKMDSDNTWQCRLTYMVSNPIQVICETSTL